MWVFIAITCPALAPPTDGSVNCTNGNNFGSVCTFTCSSGYSLVGSSTSTCGGDGSSVTGAFDQAAPTCTGKRHINTILYIWHPQ